MTRLSHHPIEAAEGKLAQLFTTIRAAAGKVPNAYADLGGHSPLALEAALSLDGALRKSSLSAREIETVKLVVSEVAGCDYCLAAHTLLAQRIGLDAATTRALRAGSPSGDVRLDALAAFVRSLVTTHGTAAAADVEAVKAAGYSDAQVVDTLLAITAITLTNLFNRVNDTVLDFPAAS
jgi:AhpD family alkylhydroperoxidase